MSEITKEEIQLRNELRARLNSETGRLTWPELERHFARGAVIRVTTDLDLIDVAAAVADDDKAAVEAWMDAGQIAHPEIDEVKGWVERQPEFWAVVIKPWVMVQEIIEH